MEKSFRSRRPDRLVPDKYSYATVISSFVKPEDRQQQYQQHRAGTADPASVAIAGPCADSVLTRMINFHKNHGGPRPTIEVYNALLNAWASHRDSEGAERAWSILIDMEQNLKKIDDDNDDDDGNNKNSSSSQNPLIPKPNLASYNTVLKAMRTGDMIHVNQATQLLSRMHSLAKDDPSLQPDLYSYTTVMTVIGNSDHGDKAKEVLQILKQMINEYEIGNTKTKPTTLPFNAALNACAFTWSCVNTKTNAFVVAISILVLMKEHGVIPDEITYGTVLRACSNLLPPSDERRDWMVERVFSKAKREGLVSNMVLKQVGFAASESLFESLTGRPKSDHPLSTSSIPVDWTINIGKTHREMREKV